MPALWREWLCPALLNHSLCWNMPVELFGSLLWMRCLRSHGCCNGLGLHKKEMSGCPEEPVMRVVRNMM